MNKPTLIVNQPQGLEYLKLLGYIVIETSIASLVSETKYVIKGEQGFEEFKIPNCKKFLIKILLSIIWS